MYAGGRDAYLGASKKGSLNLFLMLGLWKTILYWSKLVERLDVIVKIWFLQGQVRPRAKNMHVIYKYNKRRRFLGKTSYPNKLAKLLGLELLE